MSAERFEDSNLKHSKFVRARDELVLGDVVLKHDYIARIEKLGELIERLRNATPEEVDAGIASVFTPLILVMGSSDTLNLPVVGFEEEARERTIKLFEVKYPEYKIHKGRT